MKDKSDSLLKNTNLFVSNTRLTIRNLPKREFSEKDMKELAQMVTDEWLKTLDEKTLLEQKKEKHVV